MPASPTPSPTPAPGAPLARRTLARLFWAAALVCVVLPHVPFGDYALYPFAVLATWAHEMGHGLTAELLGGTFHRLELYPNLGGVAFSSRPDTRLAAALVAAGGLLGPAVAGGVVIVLGSRARTARWVLTGLGALLVVSALVWVRNPFGFAATLALGAAALLLARYAGARVETALVQVVGIRFCLESLSSVDYMFTRSFVRGGRVVPSDTQAIAEQLWLPYWVWGGLIAALSVGLLALAFYVAWGRTSASG